MKLLQSDMVILLRDSWKKKKCNTLEISKMEILYSVKEVNRGQGGKYFGTTCIGFYKINA